MKRLLLPWLFIVLFIQIHQPVPALNNDPPGAKLTFAEGKAPADTVKQPDSLSCGIITYAGQTYHTVRIGSQCWMSENLNTGKWINAGQLQKIADTGIIEKYCYGNDFVQCDYWGGLYQWGTLMKFSKEADARGICPEGWHIPASKDWKALIRFLGTVDDAGGKLKSTLQWQRPNVGANNSSGFSAYPAGAFDYLSNRWYDLYLQGYYWSSEMISETMAVGVNLTYRTGSVNMYEEFQTSALSVRCIKN
jgi:uncharacterized protein (TIGR02145 family)